MFETVETDVQCPYCGETIVLVVDGSVSQQTYVEDCAVCCAPILVDVTVSEKDDIRVFVQQENG